MGEIYMAGMVSAMMMDDDLYPMMPAGSCGGFLVALVAMGKAVKIGNNAIGQ